MAFHQIGRGPPFHKRMLTYRKFYSDELNLVKLCNTILRNIILGNSSDNKIAWLANLVEGCITLKMFHVDSNFVLLSFK